MQGTGSKYVLVVYFTNIAGEASSQPRLRPPSLQPARLKRLVGGVLAARGEDPDTINDNDVFLCFDGGRQGLEPTLLNVFVRSDGKAMTRERRPVYLTYSEDDLAARRDHDHASHLHQVEVMHCITKEPMRMVKKPRIHFAGTNRGNSLGPIALTNRQELWSLTVAQKRALYGPAGKVFVGGPGPSSSTNTETHAADKRLDTDVVPVAYHGTTEIFWEEILHDFDAVAVLDLSGTDGVLATACLAAEVPYLGIVFTEEHKAFLLDHLVKSVWAKMQDPTCAKLYQAALAEIMKKRPANKRPAADEPDTATKKPTPKAGTRVEVKPTAKVGTASAGTKNKGEGKAKAKGGAAPKLSKKSLLAQLATMSTAAVEEEADEEAEDEMDEEEGVGDSQD